MRGRADRPDMPSLGVSFLDFGRPCWEQWGRPFMGDVADEQQYLWHESNNVRGAAQDRGAWVHSRGLCEAWRVWRGPDFVVHGPFWFRSRSVFVCGVEGWLWTMPAIRPPPLGCSGTTPSAAASPPLPLHNLHRKRRKERTVTAGRGCGGCGDSVWRGWLAAPVHICAGNIVNSLRHGSAGFVVANGVGFVAVSTLDRPWSRAARPGASPSRSWNISREHAACASGRAAHGGSPRSSPTGTPCST